MKRGKKLEAFKERLSHLDESDLRYYLGSLDGEIARIKSGGAVGCQSIEDLQSEREEALKLLAQKG